MLNRTSGFSLIEMAIGLLVIGLLLGGLLGPLSVRVEQQRIDETRAVLDTLAQALSGHMSIFGRLPCPDRDDDGDENCPATAEGTVPWETLGLSDAEVRDGWGQPIRYRADLAFATAPVADPPATVSGIRLVNSAGLFVNGANPNGAAAVLLSVGKDLLGNNGNGDGDSTFTDGEYCVSQCTVYHDDFLKTISRHVLIAQLVAAGRWP